MGKVDKKQELAKPFELSLRRMTLTGREYDVVNLAIREIKRKADASKVGEFGFDPTLPHVLTANDLILRISEKEVADIFGVETRALRRPEKNGKPFLFNVCKSLDDKRMASVSANGDFGIGGIIGLTKFTGGVLHIELTPSQADAMLNYDNNLVLLDERLMFGLRSYYAKKILELISRFKNTKEYSCSIGKLCETLGTSLDSYSNAANFKITVLDKPLSAIVSGSDGVWTTKRGHPKGYHIDTVRGKKMTEKNTITFKMKYHEPEQPKQIEEKSDYSAMSMDELEAIFVEFAYQPTTTPIPKEVFEAFVKKSMTHVSTFDDMQAALSWMSKANELKESAIMKYTRITGESPL